MLRIRRIEIRNFVCFDDVVVEPSIDPARPLTIIRAENGSGKTTFLRAVRWGMYGERGLPGVPGRYSLHPAWWLPDKEGITTRVTLEFETDGSTRHTEDQRAGSSRIYHLERSVQTVSKPTARVHEPDFRRMNERTRLMVRDSDGTWTRHTLGADEVVRQLLPWGLRDFFVMDADEAVDFVGGGRDDKVLKHHDVIAKTTAAVDSLLGIEVFRDACRRVQIASRSFGARATKAVGDGDLTALQLQLDTHRSSRDELRAKMESQHGEEADLAEQLQGLREERDTELKGIGALDHLRERLIENRRRYERDAARELEVLSLYAGQLGAADLLSKLMHERIVEAYGILRPLYDSGHIPQKHITFVRALLESGECVCGQDLTVPDMHRTRVEELLSESEKLEHRANYLGEIYDATRSLLGRASDSRWFLQTEHLSGELVRLRQNVSDLQLEKKDIDTKLRDLDEDKIQIIQDEIEAVTTVLRRVRRDLALSEADLPDIQRKIDSLKKQIDQRHKKERAASDMRAGESLARLVAESLDRAYMAIRDKQVKELARRMNVLFAQMAANVQDDDLGGFSGDKATVRMIANVGLRPVEGGVETYEIYALNRRGRSMPPIEINGASRRVLALAFVLALCIESRTQAPLIADSLLNFMSGAVRRNTLRVTAQSSSQPILLLTSADLEAPSEVETVVASAGATYTLTGQWDAVEAGAGGDVVRRTSDRVVALICDCGVRQYCDMCERVGQRDLPGWTKRIGKE